MGEREKMKQYQSNGVKVRGQMERMGPKAWANDESRNTLLLAAYTL